MQETIGWKRHEEQISMIWRKLCTMKTRNGSKAPLIDLIKIDVHSVKREG